MFVPAMTMEEIRREIDKDYPILSRKAGYVAHKLEKVLTKPMKEKGFSRFYNYFSKYKNHWIYRIVISKKETHYNYMAYYHNDKGMVALSIANGDAIMYHTGHFFKRYNERCHLGLSEPQDIMRKFMVENQFFQFEFLEDVAPGIKKYFGIVPSGVILGMYNSNLKLYKTNTFLSHSMLHKNQLESEVQFKAELDKYMLTSGKLD